MRFSFILQGSLLFPLNVPGLTVWAVSPPAHEVGTGDPGQQFLGCNLWLLSLSILVWLPPKSLLLPLLGSEEEPSARSPAALSPEPVSP